MNVVRKIEALRALMKELRWDAVIIGDSDPHGNEYIIDRWKLREYISGFSGSAGTVVVTRSYAGLWTDSRYFIQAKNELFGTGVEIHGQNAHDFLDWLYVNMPYDSVIGIDGLCVTQQEKQKLENRLFDKQCFIESKPDFIDAIWTDRPGYPMGMVVEHNEIYSGESVLQRLSWLREVLKSSNCAYFPVNALDQIAWLLNIRCNDIEYNPVPMSYALIGEDIAILFIETQKVSDNIRLKLENDGVTLLPYDKMFSYLETLDPKKRVLVDPFSMNSELFKILQNHFGEKNLILEQSPLTLGKAIKNPVEIDGCRRAYVLDGIAKTRFLFWLEESIELGHKVSEIDASKEIANFRGEHSEYKGDSFSTISAYGENAAMPHYSPAQEIETELKPKGLYLIDSGAHYLSGTTDVTRTVRLGPLTKLEREDYTYALKAMIALSTALFPKGTPGCRLDSIARIELWKTYRNYGHGTGHGVGNMLNVHEGPQSFRQDFNNQPFIAGMITSCEPGIYREGSHGVRHENMLLCVEAGKNEFGDWLCFETLTMVYFDTSPLLTELLSNTEIRWINNYNKRVADTLLPFMNEKEAAWLKQKTKAI